MSQDLLSCEADYVLCSRKWHFKKGIGFPYENLPVCAETEGQGGNEHQEQSLQRKLGRPSHLLTFRAWIANFMK